MPSPGAAHNPAGSSQGQHLETVLLVDQSLDFRFKTAIVCFVSQSPDCSDRFYPPLGTRSVIKLVKSVPAPHREQKPGWETCTVQVALPLAYTSGRQPERGCEHGCARQDVPQQPPLAPLLVASPWAAPTTQSITAYGESTQTWCETSSRLNKISEECRCFHWLLDIKMALCSTPQTSAGPSRICHRVLYNKTCSFGDFCLVVFFPSKLRQPL